MSSLALVRHEMNTALALKVPLKVDLVPASTGSMSKPSKDEIECEPRWTGAGFLVGRVAGSTRGFLKHFGEKHIAGGPGMNVIT